MPAQPRLDLDASHQHQCYHLNTTDNQDLLANQSSQPLTSLPMAATSLASSPMSMPSHFNPSYSQHNVGFSSPIHKPNAAQGIQSLYDMYQQQSTLLALNDAILSENQLRGWQQQQQQAVSIAETPGDFQHQESYFNGYEPRLRPDSTASLASSSGTASVNRHSYQSQHQQHHQHVRRASQQVSQQDMQSAMFVRSSPTQYPSSQVDYMVPVSQHLHHHSLPLQSPIRPSSGQQSDRSSRERDTAPSVVGQHGMPEPAPRPKGPKLKFTPAEDTLLVELKEAKGLTWKQIADFFPGRSPGTLQVRYCTKLKAKTTVWTDEMLQRLRSAIAEYENDRWRIISSKVGSGFSASACQEKAMELEGQVADFGMAELEHVDSSEDDMQQ